MTCTTTRCSAKLIVHGPDRDAALGRLAASCAALSPPGPATNVAYLRALAEHDEVRAGRLDTGLLERLGGGSGLTRSRHCRRSPSSR